MTEIKGYNYNEYIEEIDRKLENIIVQIVNHSKEMNHIKSISIEGKRNLITTQQDHLDLITFRLKQLLEEQYNIIL